MEIALKHFYNLFSWSEVRLKPWDKNVLPWPGVYAIYNDEELVYIGSSQNLKSRIKRYKAKDPDEIWSSWRLKVRYTKKIGEWIFREIRLIYRLAPTNNRQTYRKVRT